MSGNRLFVDTNIILYLLMGNKTVADLLDQKQIYISFITQLELLGFSELKAKESELINNLLSQCVITDINQSIKNTTVQLRKTHKIKLPDAIIAASAIYHDIPLITADDDFKSIEDLNLLLFTN